MILRLFVNFITTVFVYLLTHSSFLFFDNLCNIFSALQIALYRVCNSIMLGHQSLSATKSIIFASSGEHLLIKYSILPVCTNEFT